MTPEEIAAAEAAKAALEAEAAAAAELAAAEAAAAEAASKGKPGPTDAEAKLLKEVMDKKTKLKATEDQLKATQDALKKFEGIDVESVKAILEQKKADENKKLEEKGEWDRLRAQMNEEHTKQIDTVKTEAETFKGESAKLKGVIADLTVGNAFSSSDFIKSDLTMPVSKVRVLYGSQFEYQDGQVVAYDKPAGASDRTMLVDGKGDPLSFEAAMRKIVDADPDRDQLLKSKMKAGAGSKTAGKTELPAAKFDEPRGVSKISAALNKGGLK